MGNKTSASQILAAVGGKENINDVFHCATRLRFRLKDESLADVAATKNISEVIQVVQSGGQFQVVIGNQVSTVYEELLQEMGGKIENSSTETKAEKQGIVDTMVDVISAIFTPFLSILAGTGVLKGLLSLAVFLAPEFAETGTYTILNAAGDAFFRFLPIAIAFTASKKFKTNQFIAMALAMAMVYPIENTDGLTFLGLPVIYGAGYTSTVFPIIMAVFLQRYVEGFFKKFMPKFLIFGVSLCTLVIMVPLTYLLVGPLGTIIGSVLSSGVNGLYGFSPLLTGLLIGGLWQVLVIFGMHWGFVPLVLLNLGTLGYDTLLPMAIAGVLAQAGASLGVFLKAKDRNLKSLAISSSVTAVFGITEPAVYGVTLPLKKPFIAACIGGSLGGGVMAFFGVKLFGFSTSILALPNMIGKDGIPSSAVAGAAALAVAFVTAFVVTYLIGFKEETKENQALEVFAPLAGETVSLTQVTDQVFASGAMGQGIAVIPSGSKVLSPVNGTITMLFPTKHAIGLTSDDGAEILIHIGMDTVELAGEPFTALVKEGDKVKVGQELLAFDKEKIIAHGKSIVTPIVVTNANEYQTFEVLATGELQTGKPLFQLSK